MPSLNFMGRRLGVGGDEFSIPSLCSMLLRLCWSGAVVLMLLKTRSVLAGCAGMELVYIYFSFSLTFFALAIFVEWAIVEVSLRGVIVDSESRQDMGRLLLAHMAIGGLQLVLAGIGLALFAFFKTECVADDGTEKDVNVTIVRVLFLILSASQVIDAVAMGCCCFLVVGPQRNDLLQPGNASGRSTINYERLSPESIEKMWAERCRGLCQVLSCLSCRMFGGHSMEADFAHLARVIARIFHTEEYLDVVPSDVVAGVILLRASQRDRNKRKENMRQTLHPTDITVQPSALENGQADVWLRDRNAVPFALQNRSERHRKWWRVGGRQVFNMELSSDRRVLEEVAHFSRYALAIYTWYLYVFDKPCCGACDLCLFGSLRCAHKFHSRRRQKALARRNASYSSDGSQSSSMPLVRGDNFFRVHEAGLLRIAGLHDCELAYASFEGGFAATPYAILVDHEWQCIVIAIRGTMSLDDCIVDALAEPQSLEESGRKWGFNGAGMYAHQGMVDRAEWIRTDIEEKRVLRALLGREGTAISPLAYSCESYSIRVTGHSLGGGVAVLLSYMLKKEHPTLRCIAVSPPGGLIDAEHANECKSFVVSLVLHNDMVPRGSMASLEHMRDSILDLIGRARVNKTTVMRSLVKNPRPALHELVYDNSERHHETVYDRQLKNYKTWVNQSRERRPQMDLQPPGSFIHLVKTGRSRTGTAQYTPVWSGPEDFTEMVISSSMFTDHWPTRIVPILEQTLRDLLDESRQYHIEHSRTSGRIDNFRNTTDTVDGMDIDHLSTSQSNYLPDRFPMKTN